MGNCLICLTFLGFSFKIWIYCSEVGVTVVGIETIMLWEEQGRSVLVALRVHLLH